MRGLMIIVAGLMLSCPAVMAQQSQEAAYDKLMQLTALFRNETAYSCDAVVEVRYKKDGRPVADTSRLICKNGLTHYHSRLVERVEGKEGELIVNHELKTVQFHISDSLREELLRLADFKADPEHEALYEKPSDARELAAFKNYLINSCDYKWETFADYEEITFWPKVKNKELLLLVKIRFLQERIIHYEYVNRDVYATDWEGNSRYREVKTLFVNFKYDHIPDIPVKLSDYLQWDGWKVKLMKFSNYNLSVL